MVFTACKGPKILSDTTISHQDIKVTERSVLLQTDQLTAVDTTDLSRLMKKLPVTKTDKATGIRITHQLKGNELITQVDVPPVTKTVTIADTTKVITNERQTVTEEKYSLWDKMDDLINVVIWIVVIFFVGSLLLKFIKPI